MLVLFILFILFLVFVVSVVRNNVSVSFNVCICDLECIAYVVFFFSFIVSVIGIGGAF